MTGAGTSALPLAVEQAGAIVVALLAAVAVLAGPRRRLRAGAMLAALVLTPVLLIGDIWNGSQFRAVRDHPELAAAAGVVGLLVVVAIAVAFRRRPGLFPLTAVLVLPFRLPVAAGHQTSNLLVPLYVVLAAGVLAYAVPRLRRSERPSRDAPPGRLELLLVGFVALYAIQATYSVDFSKALVDVVFFYVPFALLFTLLARLRWSRRLLLGCLAIVVAEAVIFVGVGFYEYGTHQLLLNPRLLDANRLSSFFRVNSVFFDPSVYGRFLAMVMLALAAVLVWSTRRRLVLASVAGLALLWAGLLLTFSQSSFSALLVGLAVLAALRWSVRWTAGVIGAAVLAGILVVVAFPGAVGVNLDSLKSLNHATTGRASLVTGGAQLFANRPLAGYGAGGFQKAYRHHVPGARDARVSASHTIPITVAAEQGIVGLAVYLALLAAAFGRLYRSALRSGDPTRAYFAAAFTALVFHTLLYADFLEDPVTWTLLAAGVALARVPVRDPVVEDREDLPEEPSTPAVPGYTPAG